MFSVLFFRMLALPGLSFAVYPFFFPALPRPCDLLSELLQVQPEWLFFLVVFARLRKISCWHLPLSIFFSWLIVNQNCILMAIKMSWLGFCFLVVVRQLAVATNHE